MSHHLFTLVHRTRGADRLTLKQSGRPRHRGNEVNGLAGYNEKSHTLHLLLYNLAADPAASTSERVEIVIENVMPVEGVTVRSTRWLIDDEHGNFWLAWWEEVGANIGERGYNDWSADSPEVAAEVTDAAALQAWNRMQPELQRLAALSAVEEEVPVEEGSLRVNVTLQHHGVAYIEIGPVMKVERFN